VPSSAPSQSDVLRERFSKVPWRRAFVDALRERLGQGATVIPDRIEGAVYGQLAAEARASATGPMAGDRNALIEGVAIALELRRRPFDATLQRLVEPPPAAALDRAVIALQALVVRRLVSGERSRGDILRGATRELGRSMPTAAVAAGDPTFRLAWDAFSAAIDLPEAIERALAAANDPPDDRAMPAAGSVALVAGGLAGAYWGGGAIPATWRRSIRDRADVRRRVDRLVEAEPAGIEGRRWSTSTSAPLGLDAVRVDRPETDEAGTRAIGSLGISALPGRRYVAYHTGAHWRDLDTDCARLRALGYDTLLLLVEDRELVRCRVTAIGAALEAEGIELIRHPIRDPLVPRDGGAFRRTIVSVLERILSGRSVAIACRGGLDRSGMATACVLREAGLDARTAIARVQAARTGALRLPDQQAYVGAWPPTH
jgi:hypothetical protein